MKNIFLALLFLIITIHAFKVPNALNEITAENLQSFVDSISSFKTFDHSISNKWNQSKAEEIIKTAMQCNGIPGLGVAVILEGKVVLLKGYGYRDVKTLKPFTPQTLFWTGSTAKAITSTLIGMLVDEGKLNWDTPIVNYLKDFQLIDKFATSKMTLVDTLTHRSGLPRHDLSWILNSKKERSELVHSLRVLQPNKDFRYEFQYNNLMYATAGYIAGLQYNTTFEKLVQSKILNTLMPNTKVHYNKTLRLHENISLGYYCNDPIDPNPPCKRGVIKVPNLEKDQHDIMECGNVILPAGGIISTLEDYTKWLLMNMNGGEFNGKRYISQTNLKKIFTPTQTMHEIQMDLPQPKYPGIMYYGYGLGWMFIRYRGYNMISHGGNLFGYSTMVSFLPEEKSGVILFSNHVGSTNLLYQLTFALSDMLLDLPPWITKDMICPTPSLNGKKTPFMKGTKRIDDSILGNYNNLAYGKVVVFKRGNELAFSLAGWEGTLTNVQGDTYLGYFEQSWGAFQTYFTFIRSGTRVVGVTLILEPAVDPILFDKLS